MVDKFLGVGDVSEICDRLRKNSAKKRIVLKGNCLGSAGASILADYLQDNTNIEHLSLEWNQLGNDGSIALAKALQTSRIVELDLRNNSIKSEGAVALAKAIMMNDSISSLDLRWNQIEDQAALQFKEAILDRVPALHVKLAGNLLSTDVSNAIDRWLGKEEFQEEKASERGSSSGGSRREFTGPSAASIEAQSTILQKETAILRSQNTTLNGELRDLQRQLDASAVRVTELEQQFMKEEHRGNHLSDQLKSANMRVAMQMEELKNLTALWEQDRQAHAAETKRVVSEQEVEVRTMCAERDRARDALRKAEDKAERLGIQVEQISRHAEQEREATQAELSLAHKAVTELTTAEAKLKGENAILKNSQTRSNERIAQLEADVETGKAQAAADLALEFRVRGEEVDRLRSEFASNATVLQDKISRQTRELAELYKKHAELQAETSSQRVEMQEQSDAAIAAVRESEARRCDCTVQEFRTRLDAYLASRGEVEGRCEGLSREVRSAQELHVATSTHFEKQVKEMDTELRRLREQKLQMEAAMASAQKDAQASHSEKDLSHKKMVEAQSTLDATQRSLQDVVVERGALRAQVAELAQQLDALELQRRTEFATATEHLTLSLQKELGGLGFGREG